MWTEGSNGACNEEEVVIVTWAGGDVAVQIQTMTMTVTRVCDEHERQSNRVADNGRATMTISMELLRR